MRTTAMVIGTIIMRGTALCGGTSITLDGSGAIIPDGSSDTPSGAAATAIGTTIMCGGTAIGGTKTIRSGCGYITMNGYDGTMTTNES